MVDIGFFSGMQIVGLGNGTLGIVHPKHPV